MCGVCVCCICGFVVCFKSILCVRTKKNRMHAAVTLDRLFVPAQTKPNNRQAAIPAGEDLLELEKACVG
jgi:hypothetical protein